MAHVSGFKSGQRLEYRLSNFEKVRTVVNKEQENAIKAKSFN